MAYPGIFFGAGRGGGLNPQPPLGTPLPMYYYNGLLDIPSAFMLVKKQALSM
jgi:hypothetical protein